ncbi:hypothetical protein X777_16884 [Ooceraea biroi]|uniref:Uncharacterized protein n=1 Tax=Ooceraea biroi TaxID=2015173 RepID=A0A026WSA0_OOCBI|nr:hypothetical protein X777_16884 [Ooceraea biroi]
MSGLPSDGRKLGDGQGQLFILLGAATMGYAGGIAQRSVPVALTHATVLAFLFRQFDRASLDAIMPRLMSLFPVAVHARLILIGPTYATPGHVSCIRDLHVLLLITRDQQLQLLFLDFLPGFL